MTAVRRIVLDVLKPHEPSLLDFTDHITAAETVESATASLIELDEEVQNITITIEGTDLAYDPIRAAIEDCGGTVHSIDQVACGEHVLEEPVTIEEG